MDDESRLLNVNNRHQGKFKKVLCVCTAGLLRSPTAAEVLSKNPFNFNTRSCGISPECALIVLDEVLLAWADEIVCMDKVVQLEIRKRTKKRVICLGIPDGYDYRDYELIKLISENYGKLLERQS